MKLKLSTLLLVGIIVMTAIWWFSREGKFRFNTTNSAVIKEMRDLERLETASFTIEKIIEAGTQENAFREFLFGDKILLIAHGEVIAGIDFSKLRDNDIKLNGDTVTITLPKPEIFTVRLDNDQTRVYDRQQGFLSRGDKALESEARRAAEQEILKAACRANILQDAGTNARKQLTSLLNALGFSTVILNIPDGTC